MKVGVQLYSVRDHMEADMRGTLQAVKDMGYDYVEFAGYFGKSAKEVRALLDEIGLICISVHQTYDVFLSDPKYQVDYLKTIGAKYCAIPWMAPEKHKGAADYEQTVAEITKVAKLLKDNGIQMLYHNHDFEFVKVDGKYKYDWFFDAIEGIDPEIDTCWVKYAGEDPCKYMQLYRGRINVLHLKDFTCKVLNAGPTYDLIDADGKPTKPVSREDNEFFFRPVGTGLQNFEEILACAKENGTEYVIVEQDQWYDNDSLEQIRISRENLKKLGL